MKYLIPITAFFCALALGHLARQAQNTREPASGSLREPTKADIAAAPFSQILLHGAAREEELRLRYVDRYNGQNAFGIRSLIDDISHEEAEAVKVAAENFLGKEERVSFRAEFALEGKRTELLLQFRRSPGSRYGIHARLLETFDEGEGAVYFKPAPCGNELDRFHSSLHSLVFIQSLNEFAGNGRYQTLMPEFPMRNEPEATGRHFGWNIDREDFEVIGYLRWKRLSPQEEIRLVRRWNRGWIAADDEHRARSTCLGSVDPSYDDPVPE